MQTFWSTARGVLAVGVLLALPGEASACGGLFCDGQVVDQSGEEILFVYESDGSVTTIVRIEYTGPAEEFAWILPVPELPEIGVGTATLFDALDRETAPRFTLRTERRGVCRERQCSNPCSEGGAICLGDGGSSPPPPVAVVDAQSVGPYEAVVLSATDATALRRWLTDNGYVIPVGVAAELDHYVALDHRFVALRLRSGSGVGEIVPVVLRSSNREPCVPLRLTSIAAVQNMPVQVYVLADRRARPWNWLLIEPPYADMRTWNGGYRTAVTDAVDDAGGHAFVTDYAVDVPALSLSADVTIDELRAAPTEADFLRLLLDSNLRDEASFVAILTRYYPVSANALGYYECVARGDCVLMSFDREGAIAALDEGLIQPLRDAQGWLDAHTHLTRLFTTVSPDEMTEDPTFGLSDELPREHTNVHEAVLVRECSQRYYSSGAPRTLVVGDASYRVDEGSPASADPRCPVGGCGCEVAAARRSPALALLLAAALFARARRRRR